MIVIGISQTKGEEHMAKETEDSWMKVPFRIPVPFLFDVIGTVIGHNLVSKSLGTSHKKLYKKVWDPILQ